MGAATEHKLKKSTEEVDDRNSFFGLNDNGDSFLRCKRCSFDYLRKGKTINSEYYANLLEQLLQKNAGLAKRKICTIRTIWHATNRLLRWLSFEPVLHALYSPNLAFLTSAYFPT